MAAPRPESVRPVKPRMTHARRHAQLIGVATGLFAARGLEGTTIEDISAVAQISKPVVYEHFGSKEGLYAAVVDIEFDRLLGSVTEALSAPGAGPRLLVERAALALLDYIEDHADGFRILNRDAPPHRAAGTLSTLLSTVVTRVEHILIDEFDRRGFHSEEGRIYGAMYAQMLVGMVSMTGQWWLDARSPDKRTVAAHVVNLAWNGLTRMVPDPQLLGPGVTDSTNDEDRP